MKKNRIIKRGIALAMLLVLTITALIVPTSAKVQTYREAIQPDENGVYPSLYSVKMKYGSSASVYLVADLDENTADTVGNTLDVIFYIYTCHIIDNTYTDTYMPFDEMSVFDEFGEHYDHTRDNFTIYSEGYHSVKVLVEYEAESQTGLVNTMFGGFGNTIKGITNGVKSMFNNIIYVDGTSQSGISAFAKFGFIMSGLTMALGLGYVIINKIR